MFLSVSSFFAPILIESFRIFTNLNQKLPKSPEISKMLGIIGVTGFPNYYQLFRIIDNWGWGFGPEVGGVMAAAHRSLGEECLEPLDLRSLSNYYHPAFIHFQYTWTQVGLVKRSSTSV